MPEVLKTDFGHSVSIRLSPLSAKIYVRFYCKMYRFFAVIGKKYYEDIIWRCVKIGEMRIFNEKCVPLRSKEVD